MMEQSEIEALQRWVGRTQSVDDRAVPGPLAGLASLLDHSIPPWISGEMPPLAHWLYFLPRERQSLLDTDGHPKRGDFLPPVPLPRRMWVGSRVHFVVPIAVDAAISRRSTIETVTAKSGRSGSMVFVTVKHEITAHGTLALIEEQDIVYRAAPPASSPQSAPHAGAQALRPATRIAQEPPRPQTAAGPGPAEPAGSAERPQSAKVSQSAEAPLRPRVSQMTRTIIPDPVQLFRFSALTFNAHRIHYDVDYARDVEGYPGLVVHGPLVATLLMDHFLRHAGGRAVRSFHFRAERPLFDTAPFDLCLAPTATGGDLWAIDANGATAFTAAVEVA
ncbi:MAG TPA: MaoC family dehydratase N-terminal domain-containing protein [Steroidobacteraceae bacterium]|nr:MaoC family dehydratase N-terminal domain-containing protein [Steroidobacteraceae bacterium]